MKKNGSKIREAPSHASHEFHEACELSGVKATNRQWRKWERQEGTAWKWHKENKNG